MIWLAEPFIFPQSAALEEKNIFLKIFNWEGFLFVEQILYQRCVLWKRVEVNFVYIRNCCRWCLLVLLGPCCLRAGTGCSLFSEVCRVPTKHSSYCFLLGTSAHPAHWSHTVGSEREEERRMQGRFLSPSLCGQGRHAVLGSVLAEQVRILPKASKISASGISSFPHCVFVLSLRKDLKLIAAT